MSDNAVLHLHDRFSRGESLSDEEMQVLQQWYDQHDTEENQNLYAHMYVPESSTQVRQHIAHTAAQLQTLTQQIAALLAANDTLRSDIAALQARLAQHASGRAA